MVTINRYLLCDLDGCLVNTSYIWKMVNALGFSGDLAFEIFNRNANSKITEVDTILLNYLIRKLTTGVKIIFLTARSVEIETETTNFIQEHTGLIYGKDFSVNCRALDDKSSPVESKAKRLQELLNKDFIIDSALDDEIEIVKMYRANGIKAYRWVNGTVPNEIVRECGGNLTHLLGEDKPCLN